jgi:hypothetical protein
LLRFALNDRMNNSAKGVFALLLIIFYMMRLKNASSDDFGNHKLPIFFFRGICQCQPTLDRFSFFVVAKGIGQRDGVRSWF